MNFATTLRGRKIIAWLLVFSICFGSLAYRPKQAQASDGCKAIWKYDKVDGTQIELSNKHWGWASPRAPWVQHYNLKAKIHTIYTSNWHIYMKRKCLEAYDSVSGKYFSEKFRKENKCYKNNDRGLKDMAGFLLKKSEQHQAQQELGKAGKLISTAALAAVFKWIVKIGATIYSGNPGFVLAPISLDDEDDTIIVPSIGDLYLEPLEEDAANTNLKNDEENNNLEANGENNESNSSIRLN